MRERKLEQLRAIFTAHIKHVIRTAKLNQAYYETDENIQKIVDSLIYEVRTRINK